MIHMTEGDNTMKTVTERKVKAIEQKYGFNPFTIISDDDYNKNLNSIIAYYQISKGETKKRFVSSEPSSSQIRLAS
jgi:hypothetical protein